MKHLAAVAILLLAGLAALPRLEAADAPDHRTAFRGLPKAPEFTYLPGRYAACTSCHPRELIEEEDFNVDTNWRDVTLGKNLHGIHVYRQPSGVNCSVCHVLDEASGRIAYGPKVRVAPSEKGGSCTPACHRPKQYDNAGRLTLGR